MKKNEEEDYYKPIRVGNFSSNNDIEYKSKGDKKTLSVKEYYNKIKPYLKDIINGLKKSGTWKIQLITITINFISSKDDNDEGHVTHSKSGNMEIVISNKSDNLLKNFLNHFIIDIKIIWKT